MAHPVFSVFPFFLFFPEAKRDEREEAAAPRKKLLSASERLRVPTPTERLLQD